MTAPSPRPAWLLIGPTLAAALGAFLLTVTVGTEGTTIQRDLGMTSATSVWILAAFLLAALPGAAIGALVGRLWPTAGALAATVMLVPGAALAAFTPDSALLLVGRAVTGFGAGLAWGVAGMAVARVGARLVPVVAGLVVLGLILGPVVGMVLTEAASWRVSFMLGVLGGAVAFLVSAVSGIVALTRRPTPPPFAPPPFR